MADPKTTPEDPAVAAARARRYGELRAAQRALFTSALPNRSSPAETLLQEARGQLRELAEQRRRGFGSGDAVVDATEIDRLLDRAAAELRGLALGTSFSQFRATLPHLRDSHPDEVAALLDLCLKEAEGASHARSLAEYMITLLATEKPSGKVALRCDPSVLTPGVRELCGRAVAKSAAVLDHLDVLREAMSEISNPLELEEVREQLRSYKDKMGPEFWVPEVLRALVEYNVAIQNRLEDAVEADRTLDSLDTLTTPSCQSEYTFTLPGLGTVPHLAASELRDQADTEPTRDSEDRQDPALPADPDEITASTAPSAEQFPAVAESAEPRTAHRRTPAVLAPDTSEMVEAVESETLAPERAAELIAELDRGLQGRITQGAPGPGAAGNVIMRFDLAPLSRWERMAFAAGSDAEDADALRAAVLAGLLLRHLDEIEPDLERLGLTRVHLKTVWLEEVAAGIQQAIAHALVDDSYGRAKELAETKSKFLYPTLEGRIRAGERSTAVTGMPGEALRGDPRSEGQRTRAPSRGRAARADTTKRTAFPRPRRAAVLAAVVALGLVLIGVQAWEPKSERSAQILPEGALIEISPHLQSAYRDGYGYGARFFGTLAPSWEQQSPGQRREAAVELGHRLRSFGVSEALLFDRARRLRVHYQNGAVLVPPAAPAER